MQAIPLNSCWRFRKLPGLTLDRLPDALPDGPWEDVSLPHTWYSDDDPYQGLAVYERTIAVDAGWKRAFLSFDGADQRCRAFVNGHFAGEHRGGYARFRLPVPASAMGDGAVQAIAGDCADSALWRRVAEPDAGYRLPDEAAGGAVRNWFLADDDLRKEGYFSIQSTAQELLDNAGARSVLERYIPGLVAVMTQKSVIPLGLSLKSILSRDADEALDVKALNRELNRIPDTDE